MSRPVKTTSFVAPVWLRADMPRETVLGYWAGPHAQVVGQLPNMTEYIQWHFSPTDHGYWPSSPTGGTIVPPGWRCDGAAEVRFASTGAALTMPVRMREVYLDEQNIFARVLGQVTGSGGGRWWTDGHDNAVAHRTVILLRRRRGVRGRAFRTYVHERIGPALHRAGAADLRTYTFLPWSRWVHHTRRRSRQSGLPPLPRMRRRRRRKPSRHGRTAEVRAGRRDRRRPAHGPDGSPRLHRGTHGARHPKADIRMRAVRRRPRHTTPGMFSKAFAGARSVVVVTPDEVLPGGAL